MGGIANSGSPVGGIGVTNSSFERFRMVFLFNIIQSLCRTGCQAEHKAQDAKDFHCFHNSKVLVNFGKISMHYYCINIKIKLAVLEWLSEIAQLLQEILHKSILYNNCGIFYSITRLMNVVFTINQPGVINSEGDLPNCF
jgi:hypothetical protein